MISDKPSGILETTQQRMRQAWHALAESEGGNEAATIEHRLTPRQISDLRHTLSECVSQVGGVVSARQRAAQIGETYLELNDAGKLDFLRLLAVEFGPNPEAIKAAIGRYLGATDDAARSAMLRPLREALASPRSKILPQFSTLPQGVQFLVQLRADVLQLRRDHAELAPLDEELFELLSSWFDVGMLTLERITWDSPAALLEKLIAYEAVHEIRSWNDLRNRLDSDRRLYAFFHPRMPQEPLIFVEIALTGQIADNIQHLLDEASPSTDPAQADTAIFYSISNTQLGLRGISFGNFLIKRVVDALKREFPGLKTFATLSPLPLFRRWLDRRLAQDPEVARFTAQSSKGGETLDLAAVLRGERWHEDGVLRAEVEAPLLHLCAEYLLNASESGRPVDPVARFHLGNGARVERLNWLADASAKGLRQSFGIMVNYLYDLDDIETNLETYARHGEISASAVVHRLLLRPSAMHSCTATSSS